MGKKGKAVGFYDVNGCGETMKDIRERLKAEDEAKWRAFVALREQYKMEGMSSRDAQRKVAKMAQFLPPGHKPSREQVAKVKAVKAQEEVERPKDVWEGKATSGSFRAVILWVFDNMTVADPDPADAPSPGAWWFLNYAKGSPSGKDWLCRMLDKLMPTRTEVNQRVTHEGQERNVGMMLERVREAAKRAKGAGE